MSIEKQITELVIKLKEKQGTERQEIQAMIKQLLAETDKQAYDRGYEDGSMVVAETVVMTLKEQK